MPAAEGIYLLGVGGVGVSFQKLEDCGAAFDESFAGEDIYIPLRREEAVVQKDARVREEVRVHKTAHSDQQQVSEQVRKEDVEIEESGDASRLHTEGAKAANRLREQQEKPRSQRQQKP